MIIIIAIAIAIAIAVDIILLVVSTVIDLSSLSHRTLMNCQRAKELKFLKPMLSILVLLLLERF